MLPAQNCCALSLVAENQLDHFDVLTFPSSSTRQCRVCSIGTFVVLRGKTSGANGERQRHPSQREVWIGRNRIAEQGLRVNRRRDQQLDAPRVGMRSRSSIGGDDEVPKVAERAVNHQPRSHWFSRSMRRCHIHVTSSTVVMTNTTANTTQTESANPRPSSISSPIRAGGPRTATTRATSR